MHIIISLPKCDDNQHLYLTSKQDGHAFFRHESITMEL